MTTTVRPGVRGDCPGVHTPFREADGALLRVRLPGGILSAAGLRAAAACGGTLELTSRANLQIRGLDPDTVPEVAAALVAAGLALPDPARDARRNVLASPTAGFDPVELVDTRPLVRAVAELLASATAGERSPKFGVLVDGGGMVSVRGRRHDICLGATRSADGTVAYELRVGEPLPPPNAAVTDRDLRSQGRSNAHGGEALTGSAVLVPGEAAVDAIAAAVALCPPGARMADVVAEQGRAAILELIARKCGGTVRHHPAGRPPTPAAAPMGPIGLYRSAGHGLWAGTLWCGAAPLLGRLGPGAASGLAELAHGRPGTEVRLTPWRGVILPGLRPIEAPAVVAALTRLGLSADPDDPAHRVIACAGSSGCHAGLTDTQGDAARLVKRLRALPVPVPDQTIHLSGCPKGCATRAQSDSTLVGGEAPGTYELYHRDPDAAGFGHFAGAGLPPEAAISRVLKRQNRRTGGAAAAEPVEDPRR